MSSKFNRTFVSQVPELCYDGWGLTLPSTLYQELILSKPFSQLVASVKNFVKSRDAERVQQRTITKLDVPKKKKKVSATAVRAKPEGMNHEDELEEGEILDDDDDNNNNDEEEEDVNEEEEEEDDEEEETPLFDDDNELYEHIVAMDAAEYENNGLSDSEPPARKKPKNNEQKTPPTT